MTDPVQVLFAIEVIIAVIITIRSIVASRRMLRVYARTSGDADWLARWLVTRQLEITAVAVYLVVVTMIRTFVGSLPDWISLVTGIAILILLSGPSRLDRQLRLHGSPDDAIS